MCAASRAVRVGERGANNQQQKPSFSFLVCLFVRRLFCKHTHSRPAKQTPLAVVSSLDLEGGAGVTREGCGRGGLVPPFPGAHPTDLRGGRGHPRTPSLPRQDQGGTDTPAHLPKICGLFCVCARDGPRRECGMVPRVAPRCARREIDARKKESPHAPCPGCACTSRSRCRRTT